VQVGRPPGMGLGSVMVHALAKNWWMLLLRGIAAIIFGVLAFAWPGMTLLTLIMFYGAFALVDGVLAIIAAIAGGAPAPRWWLAVVGLLGIATGVLMFTMPGLTALVLLYFIAGWAIATGAFQIVGAPGLLLAIVVRVTLPEPRMSGITGYSIAKIETVRQSVSHLRRKRSFVRLVVASQLYFLFAYGVLSFVSSFLVRVLHLPLAQISVKYGLISASGTLIGTLGGGWMADHLVRRDVRWLAWICTLAFCITGPLYIFAFTSSQFLSFSLFAFAASVLIAIGLPTLFAAIHSVCGHMRRAVAIGIVLFSATFVGGGLGPLATGALSDVLTARYGVNGLRFALICMSCLLMFSGITFIFVAKAMPHDVEE